MRKTFRIMRRTIISLALALTLSATAAAQTPSVTTSQTVSDPPLQRLEREIARLSTVSGGVVGVTAIHLETGRRVSMNGAQRFPMASTFKVPIAVQLLTRIDKGEVKLDQIIEIKQSDLHPGSGTLADLFNKGGLTLSVRNLMAQGSASTRDRDRTQDRNDRRYYKRFGIITLRVAPGT